MKKSKPFSKLSNSQKRVEIAKDVLIQLKNKRFKVRQNIYVQLPNYWDIINRDRQANECVLDGTTTCQVCAKGALFMSHVMKTNHATIRQVQNIGNSMVRERLDIFSTAQLDLIECAFEKRVVHDDSDTLKVYTDGKQFPTPLAKTAIRFGKKYKKKERLIAIIKNIIKNKGTFKP